MFTQQLKVIQLWHDDFLLLIIINCNNHMIKFTIIINFIKAIFKIVIT